MNGKSYDHVDRYFDCPTFQPLIIPRGEFGILKWPLIYGFGYVGVMLGSNILFIMEESEVADVDTWIHEFVEAAVSGVVTEVLEFRPFAPVPVYLSDERVGQWYACFCHLLAALTTGQGWLNEEYNHYIMEADDVWQWLESSVLRFKNSRRLRLRFRLRGWRGRIQRLFKI